MALPPEQLADLKLLFPKLSTAEEGGTTFIQIKNMILPDGCDPKEVTGLLCPIDRDGYHSRLFLSHKISHKGRGQNWNPAGGIVILGKTWFAVSWKTSAGQTLTRMLLDHLGAFRP
jgi:hypothetical protein